MDRDALMRTATKQRANLLMVFMKESPSANGAVLGFLEERRRISLP